MNTLPYDDPDRALSVRVPFLKPGAFLVQGVANFPPVRAFHRLGTLSPEPFEKVFGGSLRWRYYIYGQEPGLQRPIHWMVSSDVHPPHIVTS